jgi:hypothetical protein
VLSHNRAANADASVSGNDIYRLSRTHWRHQKNASRRARCDEKMAAFSYAAAPLRVMKTQRGKPRHAMP